MFYLGYLTERRWGEDTWGLLVGGGVGLTGEFYHWAKEGNRMRRSLDADSAEAPNDDQPGNHDVGRDD